MGSHREECSGSEPDELKPRMTREGNDVRFILSCGTLHREYGPAFIERLYAVTGSSFGSQHYFLFGVQIGRDLFDQLMDDTAEAEINTSWALARALLTKKNDEITRKSVFKVLKTHYGETIAKNIVMAVMLEM